VIVVERFVVDVQRAAGWAEGRAADERVHRVLTHDRGERA
jgi:hypothetical protein